MLKYRLIMTGVGLSLLTVMYVTCAKDPSFTGLLDFITTRDEEHAMSLLDLGLPELQPFADLADEDPLLAQAALTAAAGAAAGPAREAAIREAVANKGGSDEAADTIIALVCHGPGAEEFDRALPMLRAQEPARASPRFAATEKVLRATPSSKPAAAAPAAKGKVVDISSASNQWRKPKDSWKSSNTFGASGSHVSK